MITTYDTICRFILKLVIKVLYNVNPFIKINSILGKSMKLSKYILKYLNKITFLIFFKYHYTCCSAVTRYFRS